MNQEDVIVGTALGVLGGAGTVMAAAIGLVFAKGTEVFTGFFGDKTSTAVRSDKKTIDALNARIDYILQTKALEEESRRRLKSTIENFATNSGALVGGGVGTTSDENEDV